MLRGHPGVDKTALIERCATRAGGFRTIRVTGVQSERDLAFVAVHEFCSPVLGLGVLLVVRGGTCPAPTRDGVLDLAT